MATRICGTPISPVMAHIKARRICNPSCRDVRRDEATIQSAVRRQNVRQSGCTSLSLIAHTTAARCLQTELVTLVGEERGEFTSSVGPVFEWSGHGLTSVSMSTFRRPSGESLTFAELAGAVRRVIGRAYGDAHAVFGRVPSIELSGFSLIPCAEASSAYRPRPIKLESGRGSSAATT